MGRPASRLAVSARDAAAMARSGQRVGMAWIAPSVAAMRARAASTRSWGWIWRRFTRSIAACAVRRKSSLSDAAVPAMISPMNVNKFAMAIAQSPPILYLKARDVRDLLQPPCRESAQFRADGLRLGSRPAGGRRAGAHRQQYGAGPAPRPLPADPGRRPGRRTAS